MSEKKLKKMRNFIMYRKTDCEFLLFC